jgi:hypothetical protein
MWLQKPAEGEGKSWADVFHLIECRTPPEGSHSVAFIAQQRCSIEVGNNLFRRDVTKKAFQ